MLAEQEGKDKRPGTGQRAALGRCGARAPTGQGGLGPGKGRARVQGGLGLHRGGRWHR